MPTRIPSNHRRCQYTTAIGKRCRLARLPGDNTLCFFHYSRAQSRRIEPHPALVAAEILSPGEPLDSAQAVNAALTRVFRLVAEGRLSTRHATALAYLGQLILATLPHLQREAPAEPAHGLLGSDPEAALAELAQTLRRSVESDTEARRTGTSEESLPGSAEGAEPAPTTESPFPAEG